MRCNFAIVDGIHLVQRPYQLDLHNDFDFTGLDYSIRNRALLLHWCRSDEGRVPAATPASLAIEFQQVTEFRFYPRDAALPLTEDDCVGSIGYWTDEDWADGVVVLGPGQHAEPHWLMAFAFMSGAVLAVQAAQGLARIKVWTPSG